MSRKYERGVQGVWPKVAQLTGRTDRMVKDDPPAMNDDLSVYIDVEGNVYVGHSDSNPAMIKVTPLDNGGIKVVSYLGETTTIEPLVGEDFPKF